VNSLVPLDNTCIGMVIVKPLVTQSLLPLFSRMSLFVNSPVQLVNTDIMTALVLLLALLPSLTLPTRVKISVIMFVDLVNSCMKIAPADKDVLII